jgi:hypothetical protein
MQRNGVGPVSDYTPPAKNLGDQRILQGAGEVMGGMGIRGRMRGMVWRGTDSSHKKNRCPTIFWSDTGAILCHALD